MKINFIIGLGIAFILFNAMPAISEDSMNVNWNFLSLTSKQKQEIEFLDKEWQKLSNVICLKLAKDQQNLKVMLANPNISDENIRDIYGQIYIKRERLHYLALENFISKRKVLTYQQRKTLQQMLSKHIHNNY